MSDSKATGASPDLRERVETEVAQLEAQAERLGVRGIVDAEAVVLAKAKMLRELRDSNDALIAWKESALRTLAEHDKLRPLLGAEHLGKSLADAAVDEITRLRAENDALRAALESNQRDAQAIKAELPALRDDIDRLRRELDAAAEAREKCREDVLAISRKNYKLWKERGALRATLIRAEKTVEDYQRFLERAKARATRYRGLVEAAYREGHSDGVSAECGNTHMTLPSQSPDVEHDWKHSDARQALQAQTEGGP